MTKKYLVLTTGGTIASAITEKGLAPSIPADEIASYFKPKADVSLSVEALMAKDSTNMQPEDWLEIARTITGYADQFDGFIVTHGTDTMAYTASALSYLLYGFDKPVVLTGSQVPLGMQYTDAETNLQDALIFVSETTLQGVFIVFNGLAMVGTRAVKTKTQSYDAFESINYPYVARIIHGKMNNLYQPVPETPVIMPQDLALDPNIFMLKAFPGMTVDIFDYLTEHTHGVIIESFGNGGLPFERRNLLPGIQKLTAAGIPVVITTQILEEGQDISLYEVGQRVVEAGGITAGDMNTEAIVAKLMWLLAYTNDIAEVTRLLQESMAHDMGFV
ncbi:asparaginase [Weissella diestrammenae]|uniref:asparaginase n=1 Tax=Weissella diestrammenae TaxID=1162633 RepID=A0A7G9T7C3_9LACO|nr:asparaginase [Weissella diestrammenae]MCM0582011.1 asparaginase [Weissella diestrammenae]QNN75998.1 asparaginase [Weissella diestrammenae]